MRAALVLLCVALSVAAARAGDAPRKLAFERGGAVWVANLDGSGARKVATGADPAISPDGGKLAYTTDEPSKGTPLRHIAVADVASGKTTLFKDVPSDNAFGPAWSPDGSKIAFSIFTADDWQLGLVGADGSGFRILRRAEPKGRSCGSPAWAPDGTSLFCQDMEAIQRIGLDGGVQASWPLKKLVADGDMNSGSQLSVSPDGKTLLMDIDQAEEHDRKSWDGPQPAIWSWVVGADKAVRISPKPLFAWQPRWISGDELLFLVQGASEKEPSIYRAKVNDLDHRTLVVKGARAPSVP
jgi:TolB protein